MVGVAALPIRKNHHPRPLLTDDARDFQPVLPGIFHACIGNSSRVAPGDLQNLGGRFGFGGALFGRAARSHLALRQIEDAGAISGLRHLQQSAAACLLTIIAMRSDGQHVERRAHCLRSARKCARSLRVWARAPNESKAAQPVATNWSACFNDASTPNNEGYVAFLVAVSLPAVLPSCWEDSVTSSTSSTIWKASPMARPKSRSRWISAWLPSA